MAENYDALVIGAGLGGLTSASRLLEEGLRVMVVEAGPHPGGEVSRPAVAGRHRVAADSHRGPGLGRGPTGGLRPQRVHRRPGAAGQRERRRSDSRSAGDAAGGSGVAAIPGAAHRPRPDSEVDQPLGAGIGTELPGDRRHGRLGGLHPAPAQNLARLRAAAVRDKLIRAAGGASAGPVNPATHGDRNSANPATASDKKS